MAEASNVVTGTGRRKESVARVRLKAGAGNITVNGREAKEYFRGERDQASIRAPLMLCAEGSKYDVTVNVRGGGFAGQAGAVVLGVARALLKIEDAIEPKLRAAGYLTRDSRMVERKKYGRRKARRSFQYSKR